MREVFEEYAKTAAAAAVSVLLIGFAAVFLTQGQVFDAIRMFSTSIC